MSMESDGGDWGSHDEEGLVIFENDEVHEDTNLGIRRTYPKDEEFPTKKQALADYLRDMDERFPHDDIILTELTWNAFARNLGMKALEANKLRGSLERSGLLSSSETQTRPGVRGRRYFTWPQQQAFAALSQLVGDWEQKASDPRPYDPLEVYDRAMEMIDDDTIKNAINNPEPPSDSSV